MSSQHPSLLQSALSSLLLIWLSAVTAPWTAVFTAWGMLTSRGSAVTNKESRRGTALVNGGRMQKSLFIARALARQGWRVVVVEEQG